MFNFFDMWYEILKFEVQLRLRRLDTYLFFLFLLLFSIFGVDFVFQGVDLGGIKRNSPLVIAKTMGAITGLSMLVISLVMGVPILRDFQNNTASLIYVNPISKRTFFLGRFLGSLVGLLFIFSGVLWGTMLGPLMPWAIADQYLPFQALNYIQPFIWVVLPIVFFGSAVFFVAGSLSKKMMVVYTQGIFVFGLFMITKSITSESLQALLDPFSLTTLSQVSKEWSLEDKNNLLIPFGGLMLYNKGLWLSIGLVTLLVGYTRFTLNIFSSKQPSKSILKREEPYPDDAYMAKVPELKSLSFGWKGLVNKLIYTSFFHARFVLKEPSFWAMLICGLIILLANSINLGTTYNVDSYPTTYLIIEEIQEMSIYFFAIIIIFYSAEIMWKEKEVNLNQIYFSTPTSNLLKITSKLLGLLILNIVLIASFILFGIMFQAVNGYYNFQLGVYFTGFFLEILPFLALYSIMALFLHVVVRSKYLGILVFLIFFIVNVSLGIFVIDHVLINFAGNTLGTYSEMNGYGLSLQPYLGVKSYWLLFGGLLLIMGSIAMEIQERRNFMRQWIYSCRQTPKATKVLASVIFILFVVSGSFIYYNTNVLNEYWNEKKKNQFRADYEKSLKHLEYIIQPEIVDIKLEVDLYPSDRSYHARGQYILVNSNNDDIKEIHIQKLIEKHVAVDSIQFNRDVNTDTKYEKFHYTIYTFAEPMNPGDTVVMKFHQSDEPLGFENKVNEGYISANGTFFDNSVFPSFGYCKKYELQDQDTRIDFGLGKRMSTAAQDDSYELFLSRSGSDAQGIKLDVILSTDSSQTAITSGELINKWHEDDRNYFRYRQEKLMINFFSILSGNYNIIRDSFIPSGNEEEVELSIYYHPGHEYNLNRMMNSMKKSLNYYSTQFSPFQYNQLSIAEFPRYRKFAQSFPSVIPFSEALGFIMDIDDKKDVDMVFYITAHEVAHQWWGLQLEAANVQGQNTILETLSQYSAMMILKEEYSKEKLIQFLKLQYNDYRDGVRKYQNEELPLILVEDEEHLYYAKGAINMFCLSECIGEHKVNQALRRFLQDWSSFNNPNKQDRYATTTDLIQYFKEVANSEEKKTIADLFETVNQLDPLEIGL